MTPPAAGVLPPAQQYLRRAVQAATKAPWVHNTQPWRFHISPGQDQGSVELFADRQRWLPVLDPTGRQLEFSCGAALLMLRVALRADGFDAAVTMLPGQDPDHLASVQVQPGADPTEQEQALAGAIALRHSQRSPFSSRAVGAEALDELRRAAQAEGAWLAVVHRRNDQLALTVLLARADREETDNAAYGEELASWLRTDPAPDGIPVQVLPARATAATTPRPPHPAPRTGSSANRAGPSCSRPVAGCTGRLIAFRGGIAHHLPPGLSRRTQYAPRG